MSHYYTLYCKKWIIDLAFDNRLNVLDYYKSLPSHKVEGWGGCRGQKIVRKQRKLGGTGWTVMYKSSTIT